MQAVLLASSLLLVLAMLGSLFWLSALRAAPERETLPVEAGDDSV